MSSVNNIAYPCSILLFNLPLLFSIIVQKLALLALSFHKSFHTILVLVNPTLIPSSPPFMSPVPLKCLVLNSPHNIFHINVYYHSLQLYCLLGLQKQISTHYLYVPPSSVTFRCLLSSQIPSCLCISTTSSPVIYLSTLILPLFYYFLTCRLLHC